MSLINLRDVCALIGENNNDIIKDIIYFIITTLSNKIKSRFNDIIYTLTSRTNNIYDYIEYDELLDNLEDESFEINIDDFDKEIIFRNRAITIYNAYLCSDILETYNRFIEFYNLNLINI